MEYTRVVHPLAPIFDRNSRVLLLGSMPSPKSRELGFYYAHPQNRFWRVLSGVFQEEIRADTASRTAFLLRHGIALWDVLHDCEIAGAGDQSNCRYSLEALISAYRALLEDGETC